MIREPCTWAAEQNSSIWGSKDVLLKLWNPWDHQGHSWRCMAIVNSYSVVLKNPWVGRNCTQVLHTWGCAWNTFAISVAPIYCILNWGQNICYWLHVLTMVYEPDSTEQFSKVCFCLYGNWLIYCYKIVKELQHYWSVQCKNACWLNMFGYWCQCRERTKVHTGSWQLLTHQWVMVYPVSQIFRDSYWKLQLFIIVNISL